MRVTGVALLAALVALTGCTPPPTVLITGPEDPARPVSRDLLTAAIKADPRYGGLWIDDLQVMHVWATGDTMAFARQVEPLVPRRMKVQFDPALYTFAQLEGVMARVQADTAGGLAHIDDWPPAWNVHGITSIDADERTNRVQVGIWPYSPEAAAAVVQAYGPIVVVTERSIPRLWGDDT